MENKLYIIDHNEKPLVGFLYFKHLINNLSIRSGDRTFRREFGGNFFSLCPEIEIPLGQLWNDCIVPSGICNLKYK